MSNAEREIPAIRTGLNHGGSADRSPPARVLIARMSDAVLPLGDQAGGN